MVIAEDAVCDSYIGVRNPEEGSNDNRCEVDASLDEIDVSATQSQSSNPNKVDSTFSNKKK
ncbi:hypothetical protein Godav_011628 [Gossypium davidsonii]|uniref:Uncharacterized protein n=2 Tax=Gossypium TaxID=3633 RepID=A0A7J8RAK1_GOSDV|nr:hypothetical protein [Gossypium davidsonii]MBA0645933.1 hypothetical protein [Gossypium klotzschianum]